MVFIKLIPRVATYGFRSLILFDAKKPFAYSLNFRYFCGYALTLGQCVRIIRKLID